MSGTWATQPTAGRDAADPGWASGPVSCREVAFTATDSGLGIEIDCGVDTGTVGTAAGWTVPTSRSCRDGG